MWFSFSLVIVPYNFTAVKVIISIIYCIKYCVAVYGDKNIRSTQQATYLHLEGKFLSMRPLFLFSSQLIKFLFPSWYLYPRMRTFSGSLWKSPAEHEMMEVQKYISLFRVRITPMNAAAAQDLFLKAGVQLWNFYGLGWEVHTTHWPGFCGGANFRKLSIRLHFCLKENGCRLRDTDISRWDSLFIQCDSG